LAAAGAEQARAGDESEEGGCWWREEAQIATSAVALLLLPKATLQIIVEKISDKISTYSHVKACKAASRSRERRRHGCGRGRGVGRRLDGGSDGRLQVGQQSRGGVLVHGTGPWRLWELGSRGWWDPLAGPIARRRDARRSSRPIELLPVRFCSTPCPPKYSTRIQPLCSQEQGKSTASPPPP
jgi:hypothetical protein